MLTVARPLPGQIASPMSSTETTRRRSATRYFSSWPGRCQSHWSPPRSPAPWRWRAPERVDPQHRRGRCVGPRQRAVRGVQLEQDLAALAVEHSGAEQDLGAAAWEDDRDVADRSGLDRPVGEAARWARRLLHPAAQERAAAHRVGRGLEIEEPRRGVVAVQHAPRAVDDEQRVGEVVEHPTEHPRAPIAGAREQRHAPGWLCGSHGDPTSIFWFVSSLDPRGQPCVRAGSGSPPSLKPHRNPLEIPN